MRILLTSFDPFAGETLNVSREVANQVPAPADVELFRVDVPVTFADCAVKVMGEVNAVDPDAVLILGQAGGRKRITIEKWAVNLDDARIPDNSGAQPTAKRIIEDGPEKIETMFDLENMMCGLKKRGLEAEVSVDAGRFVCNHLFYKVLAQLRKKESPAKAGFVHLPYIRELCPGKEPAITLQSATETVYSILEILKGA